MTVWLRRRAWRLALRFFLSLFRKQSRAQLRIGFEQLLVRAHTYFQLRGEILKLRCLLFRNSTKIFQLCVRVWFHCRVVRGVLLWWRAWLVAVILNLLNQTVTRVAAKPGGLSNGEKVDGNQTIADARRACAEDSTSRASGLLDSANPHSQKPFQAQ